MALITALLGLVGRFAGKVLTTTLGWASTLLFGRVSKSRETALAGIALLSLAWVAALVGVAFPDAGTLLLAALPRPGFVSETVVRLAMLAVAIAAPLAVGALTLLVIEPDRRPHGAGLVGALLRGYPLALALDVSLVWLALVAAWLKGRALAGHRESAHVPVVIRPGRYEELVLDLEEALDGAGLAVERRAASRAISLPTRLLVAAAGSAFSGLVPDRLALLAHDDLEIQVHPSDLAITGPKRDLGRARAAIASRLASSEAYLTTDAEAQRLEDRLTDLAKRVEGLRADPGAGDRGVRNGLAEVDRALESGDLPFDDWQIVARIRLQVERDLLLREERRRAAWGSDGADVPEGRRLLRAVGAGIELLAAAARVSRGGPGGS